MLRVMSVRYEMTRLTPDEICASCGGMLVPRDMLPSGNVPLDAEYVCLYFTAHSDPLFDDKATLGAYEAFLDKPVSVTGLLEAVSLLLRDTKGHL